MKPGKGERGRRRKENIGNSISGGATIRTPEYISSSRGERERGGGVGGRDGESTAMRKRWNGYGDYYAIHL